MSASTLTSKPASIWAARRQHLLAEAAGENIDVGEVPCGSPVEQGEELVARELFRGERRPGRGRGGGEIRQAFTARSIRTPLSALRMTIRQNVSLSWIRSVIQPRWRPLPPGHRVRRERARARGR